MNCQAASARRSALCQFPQKSDKKAYSQVHKGEHGDGRPVAEERGSVVASERLAGAPKRIASASYSGMMPPQESRKNCSDTGRGCEEGECALQGLFEHGFVPTGPTTDLAAAARGLRGRKRWSGCEVKLKSALPSRFCVIRKKGS